MIRPSEEVLIAINRLNTEGGSPWPIFRKWIRQSLKDSLEVPDAGVAKGMAYQIVDILDAIENANQMLREIEETKKSVDSGRTRN